jgi:hypothetical protein
VVEKDPDFADGTGKPNRERFRICEVPNGRALLHTMVFLMPSPPIRLLLFVLLLSPMLRKCCAILAGQWEHSIKPQASK